MLEYILDGGFMMIPLLSLSVLAVAIIIDRVRAFRLAATDTAQLQGEFISHLRKGEIHEAVDVCESVKGPVAAVLLVGLRRYMLCRRIHQDVSRIEENVNKSMTEYAPHVIEALEKRLNLLTMVATVSPLLGMTGTVTGMIAAFKGLAEAGALEGSVVAAGISEALVTTAAGLIIAIPAAIFYTIFSKKVDRFTLDIEATAADMMESLTSLHSTA